MSPGRWYRASGRVLGAAWAQGTGAWAQPVRRLGTGDWRLGGARAPRRRAVLRRLGAAWAPVLGRLGASLGTARRSMGAAWARQGAPWAPRGRRLGAAGRRVGAAGRRAAMTQG